MYEEAHFGFQVNGLYLEIESPEQRQGSPEE